MSVDRFGNVQLSIAASDADRLGLGFGSPVVVRCGRRQLTVPYLETFAAVAPGEIVAYTDSAGLISLAVNGWRRGASSSACRPARTSGCPRPCPPDRRGAAAIRTCVASAPAAWLPGTWQNAPGSDGRVGSMTQRRRGRAATADSRGSGRSLRRGGDSRPGARGHSP